MAVVRSLEGTFYDIPDSELEQYKVPADQVKSLMEAAGQNRNAEPGTAADAAGPVQTDRRIAADPCPVHNSSTLRPPAGAGAGTGGAARGRRRGESRTSVVLGQLGKLGKLVQLVLIARPKN